MGPRPFYLVENMAPGKLKDKLLACGNDTFKPSVFSIGHRGAPLQFPEHTEESYRAAARQGAGVIECDVTFTRDKALVCRHSQCDLHTTTNIVTVPELNAKCSIPFESATFNADGSLATSARAQCCTSDISLEEFLSLEGKMDTHNPNATTAEGYLQGTPDRRSDLYGIRGKVMTHKQSIKLFKSLRVKMTPELKPPMIPMPFDGFSQQDYASIMIEEYVELDVTAKDVQPQSFNLDDVLYWLETFPAFGAQAVYLDGRNSLPEFDVRDPASWIPGMDKLVKLGVNTLAPPIWMLVDTDNGKIVPSVYATQAKSVGLNLIAWTLERSGPLSTGGGWYYQTVNAINPNPKNPIALIQRDGDMLEVLHVLARDVGVTGVFSDWPATTTYYANCFNAP